MKSVFLGVAAIAAASLATTANASSWTLKLSNIDDEMNVYVNGNVVSICKFGHKCKIDLDPFLQGG